MHRWVRQLLMEGVIGTVTAVHFEWLLDLVHGADYFRRWHRDKRNSGGLLVHKATHHFDLINFWLDSAPELVMALGGLRFYGHENAEERGVTNFYTRAHGSEAATDDPFALHLDQSEALTEMYLNAEHEDGYFRDQSVFGDGISIEDTMALLVRYDSGGGHELLADGLCPVGGAADRPDRGPRAAGAYGAGVELRERPGLQVAGGRGQGAGAAHLPPLRAAVRGEDPGTGRRPRGRRPAAGRRPVRGAEAGTPCGAPRRISTGPCPSSPALPATSPWIPATPSIRSG